MKEVSEKDFLLQVKKKYRSYFIREFQDLWKDQDVILIYERKDFPPWANVKHCFSDNACILVDKETDKVFVIVTGYYAAFKVLLYAHSNDLDLLAKSTLTEVKNFVADGYGYYIDNSQAKTSTWLAGENLQEDVHDKRILMGQKLIGCISSKPDVFSC